MKVAFQRCTDRREAVRRHLPWLAVTLPFFLLALLPLDEFSLHVCTFNRLTGQPCPFCGATRAFCSMMEGNVRAALQYNPMATLLFGLMAGIAIWHAVLCMLQRRAVLLTRSAWPGRLLIALAALAVIANWIYLLRF